MAKFQVGQGIDEYISQLQNLEFNSEDIIGRAIYKGADIVADAIIMLSPAVPALLAEDGVYIVSGIIDTREQDVLKALADCGFTVAERHEHGGWLCLVCKR